MKLRSTVLARLPDSFVGAASQAVGLSAIVVTTWFVTRTDGLLAVGELTVQLAVAAAVFGVAQWGLRNLLLVEGTRHHAARQFVEVRVLISVLALLLTLSVWYLQHAISWYAIAAIAFKFGDSFTDLRLGLVQLRVPPRAAFEAILGENLAKAGLVCVAGTAGWLTNASMATAMALAGFAAALMSIGLLLRTPGGFDVRAPRYPVRGAIQMLRRSSPIAVSTAACALLTTLPRALLNADNYGQRLGIAGVCLTLAGVMSLMLTSTWVISARRIRVEGWTGDNFRRLLGDYGKTTGILLVSAPPLGLTVTYAYGFPAAYRLYAVGLFAAAVLFYAGMGLSNVQKFTAHRERETLTYLAGAGSLALLMLAGAVDVGVALVLSGAVMAGLATLAALRSLPAKLHL